MCKYLSYENKREKVGCIVHTSNHLSILRAEHSQSGNVNLYINVEDRRVGYFVRTSKYLSIFWTFLCRHDTLLSTSWHFRNP
jgi:hypothetical protein